MSSILMFLALSIFSAILGFSGIVGASAEVAHCCFVLFLVLFLVSLISYRDRDHRS